MAFNNQPDWAQYKMKVKPTDKKVKFIMKKPKAKKVKFIIKNPKRKEMEEDNMEYTRYYDDDSVSHYVNDYDDNIILDDGLGKREGWRFDEKKLIIYTDTGEEISVFPYH